MFRKLFAFVLLGVLLSAFGCPSDSPQTEPQHVEPTYSLNSILAGEISVCKLLPDSDLESQFGISSGALEHTQGGLTLGNITSKHCDYGTMQLQTSGVRVRISQYNAGGFEEFWKEGYNGTVEGYSYLFSQSLAGPSIRVRLPDNTLMEITGNSDFPQMSNENLYSTAETVLSRINFSDDSPHQLTAPSSQKNTYVGEELSFVYPKNWEVNPMFDGKVTLEDSDGVTIFVLGASQNEVYSKENGTAEFHAALESSSTFSPGMVLLKDEVKESSGIRRYLSIQETEGVVGIMYFYQPLEDPFQPSVLALGTFSSSRYQLYETAISEILESIETQ
ncbi:hypothetical protein GF412_03805 [Candidatus Micrarchaeota archaeon]|nr:hypothetical protein [Candidatus Micrarchaeota archaeon]MBD3418075.1 hypothetical protein [Candidatus Micrarchaeota archaeon]